MFDTHYRNHLIGTVAMVNTCCWNYWMPHSVPADYQKVQRLQTLFDEAKQLRRRIE